MHLSFVRSVQMDSWTDKQIKTLRVGGNQKMKDFFEKYQVPTTLSITQKYKTPQAEAYRERILALRDGKPPSSTPIPVYKPPSPRADGLTEEEAARQRMLARCGLQSGRGNSMYSSGSRKPKQQGPDWNKIRNGFSSAWSSATEVTGKWAKGVQEKTGQWSKDIKAKMDEAKLKDKMKSIKVEDATATLKSGWSWFTKGATDILSKASESMQKLSQKDDEPFKLYRTEQQIRREEAGAPKLYRDNVSSPATATSSRKASAKSSASSSRSKGKASASKHTKTSTGDAWGDDWGDDWNDASVPTSASASAPASVSASASTPAKKEDTDAWEKDLLDLGGDDIDLPYTYSSTISVRSLHTRINPYSYS